MAHDEGSLDPREGVESRLHALETRVADLTAEIAALRATAAAPAAEAPAVTPPGLAPSPAPVPPGPAFQAPRAGPPPLPAGWARYAPNAPLAPPPPNLGSEPKPPAIAGPGDVPIPDFVPPGPPPPRAPSWSFSELEERLTGRLLAYVGGAAVLLGAILFLSLAFTRGWIDPAGRVAIGLVAAGVVFGLGVWLFETRPGQAIVATVLVGVGLGVGTISIVGATRLYELVPVELGLIGSLVLGVAAAIVAIRVDSRAIGVFGLLAVLGAPPLLGATPGPVTFALIATTLIGTTIVALQRSWRWFPLLAFALAVPQLNSWLTGDAPVGLGLIAIAGFWLVNAIAAGGEELLRPTNRLRDSSATLLVADAAYLVWGGFVLLDGPLAEWRGLFLVAVALAHGALAVACLVRQGDRHPFGLLVAGTGIAALTMAVPIQFEGSAVVIAWTAEATVLAWLSARRDHLHAGLAAIALGALAVAHFVLVEDPVERIGRASTSAAPFIDAAGMTLAFMLGALVVAAWFLRDPRVRVTLASVGALLVTYALPFELSGLALLAGWSVVAILAVAAERSGIVPPWPDAPGAAPMDPDGGVPQAGLAVVGLLPALLALGHLLLIELPFEHIGRMIRPAVPFTDAGAVGAAVLVATSLVVGVLAGRWSARVGVLVAAGIVAYALPFEVPIEWAVVGWAALAVAGYGAARLDPPAAELARWAGLAITTLGVVVALAVIAPPSRLVLTGPTIQGAVWGYLAFVALAAALAIGAYLGTLRPLGPWPLIGSGVLLVYMVSIAIVDAFAARTGGSTDVEELATQAQVALSVAWTLIGTITFAAALVGRIGPARQAGLALLALATTKVFLFDLASLDVAYRVLSLVGLGVLLLGSAYAYQRLRPGRVATP
jgi:uncharacterized membrane protein